MLFTFVQSKYCIKEDTLLYLRPGMLLYTFCMHTVVTRAFVKKEQIQTWRLPTLTLDLCAAENVGRLVTPAKKLEDTIRLAELVIEVLQQNEEHHAEVSVPVYVHASVLSHTHTQACSFMAVWAGGWLKEQWLYVQNQQ